MNGRKAQRGVATLLMAVVLVLATLGITFFMADTVVMEKQIVANEYRSLQAFHAAQAGLDYGIAYAREGMDQNDDSVIDDITAQAVLGQAFYTVSLADISSSANMSLIRLTSTGLSDDQQITRTISVLIGEVPLVPNPPDVPVVARGSVNVSGNLTVTNQYENLTVWTGDNMSAWGSSNTYIRDPDWEWGPNPGDGLTTGTVDDLGANYAPADIPQILSTTKNTQGPDVVANDINLASSEVDFIQNFFGQSITELVAAAELSAMPATEADAEGTMIGISGDATINGGTYGTRAAPTIIVVDGELTLQGNAVIYGLVVAKNVDGAGNVDIYGGLMVANDLPKGVGAFGVTFDTTVMEAVGEFKAMEVIRGSWKDW